MKAINVFFLTTAIIFNNLFCSENEDFKINFKIIQNNCLHFKKEHCNKFPTLHKEIDGVNAGCSWPKMQQIVNCAQKTYPILDDKVKQHCINFIHSKQKNGSKIEQELYDNISLPEFIIRLLEKRPLTFINTSEPEKYEATRLRNQAKKEIAERLNFNFIGTSHEKAPLVLADYLSYDEMKVAALIGLSSPTPFINNGNRYNNGIEDPEFNKFQNEGIYIASVGPRFEKPDKMEWQDIIITKEQNTTENGYGLKNNTGLIKLWSDLYGCTFPTYEEAKNYPDLYKALKHNKQEIYFNIPVYRKRMELVIEPFLLEANKRGKEQNKKIYVHAVGLGTGTWAIQGELQENTIIDIYKNIIEKNDLSYIADIDFSWFEKVSQLLIQSNNEGIWKDFNNNSIAIHFSKRNPADRLNEKNSNKLLVACYPWDGNAYPGNEYWVNSLTSSGDPAAACCSYIAILQNILINPYIKENIFQTYSSHS